MAEKEKDIALIDQYLNGDLPDAAKHEVEYRLEKDEAFRKLLEETEELIEGIRFSASKVTLEKLKSIEESLPPFQAEAVTVPLYRKPWVLGVAASLSILLVGTYFIFFQNQGNSNEELFNQHFEVYPNIVAPTVRGTESAESIKQKAYYNYDLGQYKNANELFGQLPTNEDEGAVYLYRGMCFLMMGDSDSAILSFNEYKASGFELFLPQVNWFMGLTYLRKGVHGKAKEVWEEIPEGNSYREKVAAIQSKLEQKE